MKKVTLSVILMIACMQLSAAPPIIVSPVSVVPMTGTNIPRFGKFEIGIKFSYDMPDPFNGDEIDVYAIFTNLSTGREQRVNGFWYQDYDMDEASVDPTITKSSPYASLDWSANPYPCEKHAGNVQDPDFLKAKATTLNWRVRFSPDEVGTWEYVVYSRTGAYQWSSAANRMVCVSSANKGNISVGKNKTHFVYKTLVNGTTKEESFIPLGLNTRDNRNLSEVFNRAEYKFVKENIEKIASAKGNTIRLFLTSDELGIEGPEDGLGVYLTRQKQAYALDKIFELAEAKNIKIQLVLQMNGDDLNRYLPLLRDPLFDKFELFTNPQCKNYFKQRLRYIIARWGYSTSILAYELWNEVALISNDNRVAKADESRVKNIWGPNAAVVDGWNAEMIKYAKTMDSRHMFTTSLGGPVANELLTNSLDFLGDHWYSINKNTCFNTSVFAQHSLAKHNMPYLMGESGPSGKYSCFPFERAFTRPISNASSPHDNTWFHNDLWSSLFNGSAGANLYWYGYVVLGGDCYGSDGYKTFEAASRFLNSDDFFTKDLKYATNEPKGPMGSLDIPFGDSAGYNYGNNSIPMQEFAPKGAVPNLLNGYLHYNVTTSNDNLIDVFAAKTTNTEGKIYGWVHLNEYYWGKTNFNLDCYDDPGGVRNKRYQDVAPGSIATLSGQTMTFKDLDCDGYYKVDFYSTWPQYDSNGDGVPDQGGLIPSFSQSWLVARCGQLTVNIPKLTPLASYSTAPYAPDYAFKITKMSDGWNHALVNIGLNSLSRVSVYNSNRIFYSDYNGAIRRSVYDYNTNTFQHTLISPANPSSSEKVNGVLCANESNQVFYKGGDGRLQGYYLDNSGAFIHIWMTDWANSSQNVGNYIVMATNNIYYQGADAKLHRYFYNGATGAWTHSILPYPNDANQLVGGALSVNANGTQVYYKGYDGRLQCYYLDNSNNWNHIWMTDWANTSQNVAGDVKSAPEGIFYAGTDGKLHKYYFSSVTGGWVHVLVRNQYNQTIDIPANTQLSLKGNADLIYFKGANGHMQQLYSKQSNHSYTQDDVLCSTDLVDGFKNTGNLAVVNSGEIYYAGTDNNLHMYAFGAGCTPRSGTLKTGKLANGTVEDLSDKFGNNDMQHLANNTMPMLSVVPNPFTDKLAVNTNNAELLVSVEVVDVFGRRVFASTELNSKFEISTDAFAPGIYVVTIYRDGAVLKKEKVVKK